MKQKTYKKEGYNLHLYKTNKFKTTTIFITFRRKVIKEEITLRSFVTELLLNSSAKFPSTRLVSKELERIYNPIVNIYEDRNGNQVLSNFAATVINDKYSEPGMLKETIAFLEQLLFRPNIKNGGFDTNSFNIIKNDFEAKFKSIQDNPRAYSKTRMLEHLDPNSPLSYRDGYIEDLDHINEINAYQYYQDMLKNDLMDIFVLGDIDFDYVESLFSIMPKRSPKQEEYEIYLKHNNHKTKVKEVEEYQDLKQAKLSIGFKIDELKAKDFNYTLFLYNSILGSISGKLFDSIREKNSLAYYIYSNFDRIDKIMYICAGINKESYPKTLELINIELDNMIDGNISDIELKRAQTDIIGTIRQINGNPFTLLNNYCYTKLYNFDDIDKKGKAIMKITIEDIKKLSKKIHMDTVFMLCGGDDNAD